MHCNCILDPAANLLIRHMVFVETVTEPPISAISKAYILLSSSAVKVRLSQA